MAGVKPAAKILRVLGPKDDGDWERALIGIYDYLDGLTTVAFRQSVVIDTPITDVAAYTTLQTVGLGTFPKRRVANFGGVFLITDDVTNQRSNIDVGLFGGAIKGLVPASGGGSVNFVRADGVWAVPPGTGINQLTGDVTAGPGTGSVAATLANIPTGTPAAGTINWATIAAPAAPAAGRILQWAQSGGVTQMRSINSAGTISTHVNIGTAPASQWLTGIGSFGQLISSQPAFTDISGTLGGSQFGPLTGDVTTSAYVATLANIPNATPAAGSILRTAIAAPATPAAGKAHVYVDSTSKNIAVKSDAGIVNHGVRTRTVTASNWISAIADDGSSTISQPAFSDISGSATLSQLGSGGALSVLGQAANSSGTRADIAASAGSGFALRESGSTIGWGTLATTAYGNNTVTYAKIQTTSAGSLLLGRGTSGAGNVQELGIGGVLSMSGTTLSAPKQYTLTWGGGIVIGPSLGIPATVFVGLGDDAWINSGGANYQYLGFTAPAPSTAQDWGINIVNSSLAGASSPTYKVDFCVNGTPAFTIGTFPAASAPDGIFASSAVTVGTDRLGIRISVASGTITSGSVQIYITGVFR